REQRLEVQAKCQILIGFPYLLRFLGLLCPRFIEYLRDNRIVRKTRRLHVHANGNRSVLKRRLTDRYVANAQIARRLVTPTYHGIDRRKASRRYRTIDQVGCITVREEHDTGNWPIPKSLGNRLQGTTEVRRTAVKHQTMKILDTPHPAIKSITPYVKVLLESHLPRARV